MSHVHVESAVKNSLLTGLYVDFSFTPAVKLALTSKSRDDMSSE
jgi:hypothetical protein